MRQSKCTKKTKSSSVLILLISSAFAKYVDTPFYAVFPGRGEVYDMWGNKDNILPPNPKASDDVETYSEFYPNSNSESDSKSDSNSSKESDSESSSESDE